MKSSIVSVIVVTKNSDKTLDACLESVVHQSYKFIELIVVDNNSIDSTKKVAKKYTKKVFNKGPERSVQRNYGVKKSIGKYVAIIDSDMVLSSLVIEDCIYKVSNNSKLNAVIIPEESYGEGFWAKCKILERSFYVGVEWMEAARFFDKRAYELLGGYNETLISSEDWDLSQRAKKVGGVGRVDSYIFHNEGKLGLIKTMKKKYYYAKHFSKYLNANSNSNANEIKLQKGVISRYKLYFSKPHILFKNPFIGIGMLLMKTCEYTVGGVGYLIGMIEDKKEYNASNN